MRRIKLNKELTRLIEAEIAAGYITKNVHPENAALFILNYTNKCQIEWRWNKATRVCRGLIVNASYEIIARSYDKFFSYEQLLEMGVKIPYRKKFKVYDKSDGSLGVSYFMPGDSTHMRIASRGSFDSDMATEATLMLRTKYKDCIFYPRFSYAFEIIYPENKIIVDYGDDRKLILHGIFDNETGKEIPLDKYFDIDQLKMGGLPITREIGYKPQKLLSFDTMLNDIPYNDNEGFVVVFESGLRVKVKYKEYLQKVYLKRITTPRRLLVRIRENTLEELIEGFPESAVKEVRMHEKKILDEVAARCRILREQYENLVADIGAGASSKEFSAHVKDYPDKHVMYSFWRGDVRRIRDLILKRLERELKEDIDGKDRESRWHHTV